MDGGPILAFLLPFQGPRADDSLLCSDGSLPSQNITRRLTCLWRGTVECFVLQRSIRAGERGFRDHFDEKGFARQLQKAGYHTAMISPFGQRHAAWQFYAGFNEIHNTGQGGSESAEVVQPVIEKWFNDHASEDNWYMHINFWDIHTPYRAPMEYPNPFENEPIADWLTEDLLA